MPSKLPLPTSTLKIHIHDGGKSDFPVMDLICLQATGNYSWLHWKSGERMLMPRTLKYYMDQLPKEWFVRLHRNCIVNRQYIQRIERADQDSGGLVYLHTDQILPVSRRRWFAIRQLLIQHS